MPFAVGDVISGTVTGITKFGAFVDIGEGKTGLVHISEVADTYVNDVNDFLKLKDKIEVKVIAIEASGKIGLSIRQAKAPTAAPAPAERPPKPFHKERPSGSRPSDSRPPMRRDSRGGRPTGPLTFEDKLARFMKESDEVQQTLKAPADGKRRRGGRPSSKDDRDNGYK